VEGHLPALRRVPVWGEERWRGYQTAAYRERSRYVEGEEQVRGE
jgi:hypothetical protein